MILFSITFNIENSIQEQWFSWMKNTQMPAILLSGLIPEYKILKMINEHDNGGTTYSCQFFMNDMTDVNKFESQYEPYFIAEVEKEYKGQYVMFKTLLEVVL